MNNFNKIKDIVVAYILDKDINITYTDELIYDASILKVDNILNYKFKHNNIYKAAINYEKHSKLINEINNHFKDINYVYLKGHTIAKYYEEPYIRSSVDIDIYTSDYDSAKDILIANGFKLTRSDKQECSLINKDKLNVDLHSSYFLNEPLYENVFINSKTINNELDNNYKYLYNLIHCLKHFKQGILELRFFVDLYYLRQLIDKQIINQLLIYIGLETFDKNMNHYLDSILNNDNYSEIDELIEEYMISYMKDEGINNRTLINAYGKNKIKYLLSRIFISYDLLKAEYPKLNNKILMPIYYAKRIKRIINSRRKKYAFNEIKHSLTINNDLVVRMHENMGKLGIK